MISCSVCAHPNDDLETVCAKCGSFIQDRVPNLDFFSTLWRIVESPSEAFHRIIVAEHKNYVLFQMTFLGIAISFALLWARHAGNEFDNLLYLLLLGVVVGLAIALPVGVVLAATLHGLVKFFGGKGTMKNTYAVVGWSLTPVLLSVSIILPIELGALGLRLFSTAPSPMEVKPVVYAVLLLLDAVAGIWSIQLARIGLSIAHKISSWKALEVVVIVCLVFSTALYQLFAWLIV
ncbi:MAG TPA: Yip1 family protein [Bacteroidota bacterium]|nr:Yip1 family protein [Bacteroidota bacterium]